MSVTGNQSANVSGTKYIDSRCIVEFRPDNNWKGEYGFDWYRRGDTLEDINGTVTKSHYNSIVGEYVPRDPDYGKDTGTLQTDKPGAIPEKSYYADKLIREEFSIFKIKGLARNYIAPYISLYYMSTKRWEAGQKRTLPVNMLYMKDGVYYEHDFCKMESTIKLLINAKNIDKIVFKCDESLTVRPNNITGIPDGESSRTITIRYNYAFNDNHKAIKVFARHKDGATETFAGQLNVVKCEPKTVNICFVNVLIKTNKTISFGIPDNNFRDTQQKNLKRFFSQAHIIPNITTRALTLEKETIANNITSRKGKLVILKYTLDNNHEYIGSKLEQWFNEQYPNLANSYKIFFIGNDGMRVTDGKDYYLGGHANGIPSKGLVIYKNPGDSVVCHEILHCFGLYHSFSNKSKHTFEKYKTSNIMDYSRNTVSLWRWQWNVIKNAPDVNII